MGTSKTLAPFIKTAEEGDRRWFYGGGVQTWKASAEETGGAFLLLEATMEQGKVTPLHTHPCDESMYLLDGEILMHMNGEEYRIGTGGLVVTPRGVPHAFMVLSPTARLLGLQVPGTCQAFYLDASEPIGPEVDSGPVDFDRIRASAERNGGIEILGPPPFTTA